MSYYKKEISGSTNKDAVTYIVSGPSTDTNNAYAFFKFVSSTPKFLLEGWYQDMIKRGCYFIPDYENAIKEKIATGVFSNPLDFYEYFGAKFDYIAIDFKTANFEKISACALGLVFVKNDTILDSDYHYIKPPEGTVFSSKQVSVHEIEEDDVEYCAYFDYLWRDELKQYFNENLIVVHNAAINASILRELFDYYQISDYNIKYVSTMDIAKLLNYPTKLKELCDVFDIKIGEDNEPASTAIASAEIASKFIELGINFKNYSKLIYENKHISKRTPIPILNKKNIHLDKLVSIGIETLTSLQITHKEKISLINDILNSIKEISANMYLEQEMLVKMITKAYDKILLELEYDEDILAKISNQRENLIIKINNGTLSSYPWDDLIAWTDGYTEFLQNKLNNFEKQIKILEKVSRFTNYYINTNNTLKFEVSGISHLNEMELAKLKTLKKFDSKMLIELDPNNEYDSNSILVKTEDNIKIGYVNKEVLPYVKTIIGRITKCEISKISEHTIPYVWIFIAYSGNCLIEDN